MLYHCDELAFRIISVNRMKNVKGLFKVAPRQYHALAFRVDGNAKFLLPSGNSIFSSKQDVFFLSAGVPYEVEYTDGETIAIHFTSEDYNGTAENYEFTKSPQIYELFDEILKKWQKKECIYKINSLFYELLFHLREEENGNVAQDNFHKAVLYMNKNFSNPELNIAKICQICAISEANFRLKFSKMYGEPPIKYLMRLRIEHAVRLLSANTLTVEEVAQESGFLDSKYFSRVIKKYYGISPSQLSRKFLI